MYVTTCPVCRNVVVYSNFEESVSGENCPHCKRRKQYEAELSQEYFGEGINKSMYCLERCRQFDLKNISKRPSPPL